MTSILFDFSNLRVGGGLQVASAVLHDLAQPELRARFPWLDSEDVTVRVSNAVAGYLAGDVSRLPGKFVLFDAPRSLKAFVRRPRLTHDLRFTLFGPPHTGRVARREIIGFAEGTLLYKVREYRPRGLPNLRYLVRGSLRKMQVPGWDVYITESAAIAERLQRQFPIHADQVHVVPNRPHPVFCETPIMSAPTQRDDELHLVYPARAYTHKNIDLIGPAGEIYAAKTGGRVVLHTTLRDLELRGLTPSASRWVQNHGELTPKALLDYYALADASFFPSMLESSSATPLEANVLGIPLIACDRDFVRLNATAAAVFDPFDAHSAAEALIAFAGRRDAARAEARRVAENYREMLGRTSRTGDYLSIVAGELERLRAAPQRSVA